MDKCETLRLAAANLSRYYSNTHWDGSRIHTDAPPSMYAAAIGMAVQEQGGTIHNVLQMLPSREVLTVDHLVGDGNLRKETTYPNGS